MIYFVQPPGGGPVKIGFSNDVISRAFRLRWHYGRELNLLGVMDGDRDKESEIHAQFAHLQFGRTEQFRPAPELMAFIGKPQLVATNPNAVEAMISRSGPTFKLAEVDHERLESQTRKLGLSKSSYARMAVLERIKADEGRP